MTACKLAKKRIQKKKKEILFDCKMLKCRTGWYQSLLYERMSQAELAHWSQLQSMSWWARPHMKGLRREELFVGCRGHRSAALLTPRQWWTRLLHNSHPYKDIYFCALMFGLSLILAAKQTLGLNLRVSVMLACSSPTLERRSRVMRLERLTKTNL